MASRAEILREAVEAGLMAIEFCGRPDGSIIQVAEDHGIEFSDRELRVIKAEIRRQWDKRRKEAGVSTENTSGFTESLISGIELPLAGED